MSDRFTAFAADHLESNSAIELDLLGDVRGKHILHLQCHFGQDTLSMTRMGADYWPRHFGYGH